MSDQRWIVPCGHSDTTQRGGGWHLLFPGMGSPTPSTYWGGFKLISPARTPLCRKPLEIEILELLHKDLGVLPTLCHLLCLLQPWGGG